LKLFFDSSVLVAAFVPTHEHHARSFAALVPASRKDAGCATHSLAEVYAILTRYPGAQRISGDQAVLVLEEIERRLAVTGLDGGEYLSTMRNAAAFGVAGGAVYDALVAACAIKAGADRIYTWNVRDFSRFGPEIERRVHLPPAI